MNIAKLATHIDELRCLLNLYLDLTARGEIDDEIITMQLRLLDAINDLSECTPINLDMIPLEYQNKIINLVEGYENNDR